MSQPTTSPLTTLLGAYDGSMSTPMPTATGLRWRHRLDEALAPYEVTRVATGTSTRGLFRYMCARRRPITRADGCIAA